MKIIESRKEDEYYFQGPFWIVAESLIDIHKGNFQLIEEKFLSDYKGQYLKNDMSKSQKTHKKLWDKYAKEYNNVPYDYYPRGRVAICEGEAFIHINSKINIVNVIDKIISDYNLSKLEVTIEENDVIQGSHYDFKLKVK